MRYKTLGKTGLKVSELCLGTWGMGGTGWDTYSKEDRIDTIRAAIEHGINFIDTAPAYNHGAAEKVIGEAIESLNCRDKLILCTKCSNDYINGQYVRDGHYDHIIEQCIQSLENLKTDYLDILLVHWPDPNTPLKETFAALSDLKKQGKVKHIGVSNFSKEQIMECDEYCEIEVFQPQFSMVCQKDIELIRWAHDKGIGIMGYGSLGGGILTGRYRTCQTYDKMDSRNRFYPWFKEPEFSKVMSLLKVMDKMSQDKHVPLSQITLNWTTQKDFIDSAIVGAQTRAKIKQNMEAFNWKLSDEEIAVLDKAIKDNL